MKTNELDKLLSRYYEGMTSRDEERRLCLLLAENDSPQYDPDRAVLGLLAAQRKLANTQPLRRKGRRATMLWIAAASIALLLGISGWIWLAKEPSDQPAEQIAHEDKKPETAIAPAIEPLKEEKQLADNTETSLAPTHEAKAEVRKPSKRKRRLTPTVVAEAADDIASPPSTPEEPLLANTAAVEQPRSIMFEIPTMLESDYGQTKASIRQRGERLMSRMMASNTTEIN